MTQKKESTQVAECLESARQNAGCAFIVPYHLHSIPMNDKEQGCGKHDELNRNPTTQNKR